MKNMFFLSVILILPVLAIAQNSAKIYRPITQQTVMDVIMENGDTLKSYTFYKDEWYRTKEENSAKLMIDSIFSREEIKSDKTIIADYAKKSSSYIEHEPIEAGLVVLHDTTAIDIDTLVCKLHVRDTLIDTVRFINHFNGKFILIPIKIHTDTTLIVSYTYSNLKDLDITSLDTLKSTTFRFSAKGHLCTWVKGNEIKIVNRGKKITPTEGTKQEKWYESVFAFFKQKLNLPYWLLLVLCIVGCALLTGIIILLIKTSIKQSYTKKTISHQQNEDIEDSVENTDNNEITQLKEKISDINEKLKSKQTEVEKLEKEIKPLRELEQKYKGKVEEIQEKAKEQVQNEKKNAQKEIDNAKNDCDKKIKKSNNERDEALQKVKTIREEVEQREKEKYDKLKEEKTRVDSELKATTNELKATASTLETTEKDLENRIKEIARLNKEQEFYTTKLTVVEFAQNYANDIKKLISMSNDIQSHAIALLETAKNRERILTAISKFNRSVLTINMLDFYADVDMISDVQMVLKSRALATYNQQGNVKELTNSMILYFYDNYLMKYIDALVVLNESLLALDKFGDVKAEDVKLFVENQSRIDSVVNKLGLVVNTVHLFEDTEDRMYLDITTYHGEYDFGTIVEIENCWVYVKGGNKPSNKIHVKAQG